MIVYTTKYTLTSGVEKIDIGDKDPIADGYLIKGGVYYSKNSLFTDVELAVAAASKLRDKKIASLEKQITKLRNLEIKVVEG
jgi:hypothetical protein